jgi:hypothetical protein
VTENGSRITYAHLTQRHFRDIRVATQYLQGRNAPAPCPPASRVPRYANAGMTSRANSSIERSTRPCSRSPNQKLQLKCVMPTSSWMRLI